MHFTRSRDIISVATFFLHAFIGEGKKNNEVFSHYSTASMFLRKTALTVNVKTWHIKMFYAKLKISNYGF